MDLAEEFDEQNHPSWLYQGLVEDCLPWERSQRMSFPSFNQRYTLHDSYWIGIFYDVGYGQTATLAVQWDVVWLPRELKQVVKEQILNESTVRDWPYLFIQLTRVEQVSVGRCRESSDWYGAIAGCEFAEVEGKKFLAIDNVLGEQISIIYRGEEMFLAMDRYRRILSI